MSPRASLLLMTLSSGGASGARKGRDIFFMYFISKSFTWDKEGKKQTNHSISLSLLKPFSSASSSKATGQEGAALTTKKHNVAFLPHFLIMSSKKFWIPEALLASLLRTRSGASPKKQAGLEQEMSAEKLVTEQLAAKLKCQA